MFLENVNVSLGKVEGNIEIQRQILKNVLRLQQQHQAIFNCMLCSCSCSAVNISLVTVNCFLFDIMVLAMTVACSWYLAVNRFIVRCHVTHELANEWACCSSKNTSYITRYKFFHHGKFLDRHLATT